MKLQSLCVFIVLLCLFNQAQSHEFSLKNLAKSLMNGNFWFQKIYRGDDPLLVIKYSQQSMTIKFFTINSKVLAYSANSAKAKQIEGNFKLFNYRRYPTRDSFRQGGPRPQRQML
jgi:hypothetical protein